MIAHRTMLNPHKESTLDCCDESGDWWWECRKNNPHGFPMIDLTNPDFYWEEVRSEPTMRKAVPHLNRQQFASRNKPDADCHWRWLSNLGRYPKLYTNPNGRRVVQCAKEIHYLLCL